VRHIDVWWRENRSGATDLFVTAGALLGAALSRDRGAVLREHPVTMPFGFPGPSVTAVSVAALRAVYSAVPVPLGIVRDPFARNLLPWPIPLAIAATERSHLFAGVLHRALSALSADMSTNLPLRTAAIDEAIVRALSSGACQVVLLGSGLDARAWRMPELATASVFELDRRGAHAYKDKRLGAFPSKARRHRLVAIDFERQSLAEALSHAGFDPALPTIWLWEAVAVYLTHEAIAATLDAIRDLSSAGSTFLATYTRPNLGQGSSVTLHWRIAARMVGEPVRGEMATDTVRRDLDARGFDVVADEGTADWIERYWPASERSRESGWERLVVAVRRSDG
jgi:methyltransferase (TIGR00027 family)